MLLCAEARRLRIEDMLMKKITSRRKLLRSSALPALAILGLALTAPLSARADDCHDNCSGSCYKGCTGSCMEGCEGSCMKGCEGGSK